jgi:hypothetical protein
LIESTYLEKAVWFLSENKEYGFVNSYSVAFENTRYMHLLSFQIDSEKFSKSNIFPISMIFRRKIFDKYEFDDKLRYGNK